MHCVGNGFRAKSVVVSSLGRAETGVDVAAKLVNVVIMQRFSSLTTGIEVGAEARAHGGCIFKAPQARAH